MSKQAQTDDGSPSTQQNGKQECDEKCIHTERPPSLDLGTPIPILIHIPFFLGCSATFLTVATVAGRQDNKPHSIIKSVVHGLALAQELSETCLFNQAGGNGFPSWFFFSALLN